MLADAPCRAVILNHKNHSGDYPCHRCMATLKVVEIDGKKKKVVDLLTSSQLKLKDMAYYKSQFDSIMNSRDSIFGIKGPSLLLPLNFDYVEQTLCEVMHCVFLGVEIYD